MDLSPADRARRAALREAIRRHDHLYYAEGRPEVSDAEYDRLFEELERLEAQCPEEVPGDSPTRRVGGHPIGGFERVRHDPPMLSLEKAKDPAELERFDARIRRELAGAPVGYVVEPKVDGVSIGLRYRRGELVLAATRGNGREGDDITGNARTIRAVPLRLSGDPPGFLEVRGEVYMDREGFERLNERLRERGEEPFPNPRNATAGSLKLLDPRLVAERPLCAVFYALARCGGGGPETHSGALDALRAWGLPTPRWAEGCPTMEAALEAAGRLKGREREMPFGIDGVVIKVNELRHWERLGLKTRHPAYAIAYKPREWLEQASTRLLRVSVQVGRTGALTPVAEFEPVFLDGSTVRRATLHNFEELARKDLREGDTVVIEKAGRVIPAVVRAEAGRRTGTERPVREPSVCPECGGPVGRRPAAGGAARETVLRCENLQCPAQATRRVEHAAQRAALDLEGLGGIVADRLVERGWIRDAFDLFSLPVERLAALNLGTDGAPRRFGAPNARRLLRALDRARALPLSRWLFALAIPEVGVTTAERAALDHPDLESVAASPLLRDRVELDALRQRAARLNPRSRSNPPRDGAERARREADWAAAGEAAARLEGRLEGRAIRGIGPHAARALVAYFESEAGRETLARLRALGLRPLRAPPPAAARSDLAGKTVVLTGSVPGFTRAEAAAVLRAAGATVAGAVGARTDLVIAGAGAAAGKLARARERNLPVVRPEDRPELRPPAREGGLFDWVPPGAERNGPPS